MTALRTVLGNVLAIYRRELQSYLASPLAYVIAAIFWLLGGFFLVVILFSPEGLLAQIARRDQVLQMGVTLPPLDVAYEFLQGYLGIIGSLSIRRAAPSRSTAATSRRARVPSCARCGATSR